MKLIFNKIFLRHDISPHPENPNRLKYFKGSKETEIESGEEFLELAHSKQHIDFVKRMSSTAQPLDSETLTTKDSYETACYAVGAAIKAAEQEAFALVRPPGHHASSDTSEGFCLFNNIAIAAKYLVGQGKRVFILDFDLHHGNGTQEIVLNDKNIFYFSLHQSPMYPGTGLKNEKNCINVPLPFGTDDDEYIKQLNEKLMPALSSFSPDIVGVSAGFDSYYKDFMCLEPTAGFKLTEKSYLAIKNILKKYKSFFVLEGGYNPLSIKEGVDVFVND